MSETIANRSPASTDPFGFYFVGGPTPLAGCGVAFQFTVNPDRLPELCSFDITRQIKTRLFHREHFGVGSWIEGQTHDFPPGDQPNDDEIDDDDEDVTDRNQHIYSWDRPQIPCFSEEYWSMFGAKEYAVVKFDGTRPQPGEGSRCSDKVDWHIFMHVRSPGQNVYPVNGDGIGVGLGEQGFWSPP